MRGISGKIHAHVAMYVGLQIDTDGTQRTDHHIGTHTALDRHIAAGIGESLVSRIVEHGDANLGMTGSHDALDIGRGMRGRSERERAEQSKVSAGRSAQVFWITIFGNWIDLLRARSDNRPAALRAISR